VYPIEIERIRKMKEMNDLHRLFFEEVHLFYQDVMHRDNIMHVLQLEDEELNKRKVQCRED
jgi:hypothetical protein